MPLQKFTRFVNYFRYCKDCQARKCWCICSFRTIYHHQLEYIPQERNEDKTQEKYKRNRFHAIDLTSLESSGYLFKSSSSELNEPVMDLPSESNSSGYLNEIDEHGNNLKEKYVPRRSLIDEYVPRRHTLQEDNVPRRNMFHEENIPRRHTLNDDFTYKMYKLHTLNQFEVQHPTQVRHTKPLDYMYYEEEMHEIHPGDVKQYNHTVQKNWRRDMRQRKINQKRYSTGAIYADRYNNSSAGLQRSSDYDLIHLYMGRQD